MMILSALQGRLCARLPPKAEERGSNPEQQSHDAWHTGLSSPSNSKNWAVGLGDHFAGRCTPEMCGQAEAPFGLPHSKYNQLHLLLLRNFQNALRRRSVFDNVLGLAPEFGLRRNKIAEQFHGGADELASMCQFSRFRRLDHMQQNKTSLVLLGE